MTNPGLPQAELCAVLPLTLISWPRIPSFPLFLAVSASACPGQVQFVESLIYSFVCLFIYWTGAGLCVARASGPVSSSHPDTGRERRRGALNVVSILRFLFHFPVWPILSLVKVEAQEVWSWGAGASGDRSHPSPYSASGAVQCSSSRSLLSDCAALLMAHMEPPALTLWVVWLHRLELRARCLLQLVRFQCVSCFLKINPLC